MTPRLLKSVFAIVATSAVAFAAPDAAPVSAPARKILFFSKSSGFEHSVIAVKNKPGVAEKALVELGEKNNWEFHFSKDGSKFSPDYLKQFSAVFFYTTGDLTTPGTDGQPPMTAAGKQALIDYVRDGGGFVGTHSASDTFHTDDESKKGPDRYVNHGDKADPYVRMLGGEFIKHDAQQKATLKVIDPKFPGFEHVGATLELMEEWYSLKDFSSNLHVLLVQDTSTMKGEDYERPPYPSTWARTEGKGRVFYTSMGHRDDVWANPTFREILTGGLKWAMGDARADVTPNLKAAAPQADQNPVYHAPKPAAPGAPEPKPAATPAPAK